MLRHIVAAIAAAPMMFGPVYAATSGEYENNCAMGYALDKDIPTDCSVKSEIDGKTYCFGNAEAQTLFMKDPQGNLAKAEKYAASKKK